MNEQLLRAILESGFGFKEKLTGEEKARKQNEQEKLVKQLGEILSKADVNQYVLLMSSGKTDMFACNMQANAVSFVGLMISFMDRLDKEQVGIIKSIADDIYKKKED
ncbi:hypothetical protein FAX13_06080 [Ligilactobacillus animalis]|nr:hypothetical protein FAX13_06080 [Ligilactobacillus animalis]